MRNLSPPSPCIPKFTFLSCQLSIAASELAMQSNLIIVIIDIRGKHAKFLEKYWR